LTDDMVRRVSDLEARVTILEGRRDEQVTEETRRAVRKLIAHRDEGERVQLVLSFRQVTVLADLLERVHAPSQSALTGVSAHFDPSGRPS
jgi:hypothetical protein